MPEQMSTFENLGEDDQDIARAMSHAARGVLLAFGRRARDDDPVSFRFDEACAAYLQAGYELQGAPAPAQARSVEPPAYRASIAGAIEQHDMQAALDEQTIARAMVILAGRALTGAQLGAPDDVTRYLRLHMGARSTEAFAVLFLSAQHQVIELRTMFEGSLSTCTVYPREVARAALQLGAAAVILVHNHPSGSTEPSRADELLTQTIKGALALLDVRVLDHFIVSATGHTSMAARGLI